MAFVKLNCFSYSDINRSYYTVLSSFAPNIIKENSNPININTDNIISISDITYKIINKKKYYGYYIITNNNYVYWILSENNNYDKCLLKYLDEDKKEVRQSIHLNDKKYKK